MSESKDGEKRQESAADARRARVAGELRANLKKRKEQARRRVSQEPEAPPSQKKPDGGQS